MKLLAIIPAKKESERLEGKNLAPIGGKPMIEHTFEAAWKSKMFDDIVVITDDEKIKTIARSWEFVVLDGTPTVFRGRVKEACQHVISHQSSHRIAGQNAWTHFCLLLPTNPLRTGEDIKTGFSLFGTIPTPDFVVSVSEYPFNAHYALRPWEEDGKQGLDPLVGGDIDKGREHFPTTYFMDGAVYWASVDAFIKNKWSVSPTCPNTVFMKIPPERAIEVDTPFDLKVVRALMEEQEPT